MYSTPDVPSAQQYSSWWASPSRKVIGVEPIEVGEEVQYRVVMSTRYAPGTVIVAPDDEHHYYKIRTALGTDVLRLRDELFHSSEVEANRTQST